MTTKKKDDKPAKSSKAAITHVLGEAKAWRKSIPKTLETFKTKMEKFVEKTLTSEFKKFKGSINQATRKPVASKQIFGAMVKDGWKRFGGHLRSHKEWAIKEINGAHKKVVASVKKILNAALRNGLKTVPKGAQYKVVKNNMAMGAKKASQSIQGYLNAVKRNMSGAVHRLITPKVRAVYGEMMNKMVAMTKSKIPKLDAVEKMVTKTMMGKAKVHTKALKAALVAKATEVLDKVIGICKDNLKGRRLFWKELGDKIKDGWKSVKKGVTKAGQAIKGAAIKAGNAIKDTAVKAGKAIKGAAIKTGKAIKGAAVKVVKALKGKKAEKAAPEAAPEAPATKPTADTGAAPAKRLMNHK